MSYKEIAPGDIIKVKVTAVKPYGAFNETICYLRNMN